MKRRMRWEEVEGWIRAGKMQGARARERKRRGQKKGAVEGGMMFCSHVLDVDGLLYFTRFRFIHIPILVLYNTI